jgi:hypothetical protein
MNEKRKELFLKKNVVSCYTGRKTINGVETDEECLVVGVKEKVPLDSLKEGDIIPKYFDGQKTDVLKVPMMRVHHCADGDGTKKPSEHNISGCPDNVVDSNNQPFNCLPAGSSIGIGNEFSAGTLGFYAVDSRGKICAITNNHVGSNHIYYPEGLPPIHFLITQNNIPDGAATFSFTRMKEGSPDPDYPVYNMPNFDGTEDNGGFFEVGRTYIFELDKNCTTTFWLSVVGNGNGFSAKFKNSKILDNNGNEVPDREESFGYNIIGAGESLEFQYNPLDFFEKNNYLYYFFGGGNPDSGIDFDLFVQMYWFHYGVPYCFLEGDPDMTPGQEHEHRNMKPKYFEKNKALVTPSNLEDLHLNSGTKPIGKVVQVEPIKFEHAFNYSAGGLQKTPSNLIDACVIELSKDVCPSNETVGLTSSYQDVEYNPLLGSFVYKSGRTTGVTPPDDLDVAHKPRIISTDWTGYIQHCPGSKNGMDLIDTWQHDAFFEDCIYYEGSKVWFSDSGDSGSGVYIDSDSGKKLIALHFGGGATVSFNEDGTRNVQSVGVGCKVKNVMNTFNLTPWNGKRSLPKSLVGDSDSINICGKTFVKTSDSSLKDPSSGRSAGSSSVIFED